MYRMILAVIDGSDSSQSVVDQAIAMASAFRSNIHILHTGSSDEEQNTAPASPKDTGIKRVHETPITRACDLIKSAQQLAERFGIHISGTVHPKSDFLQSITNVASQVNCDLIMLGGDCPRSPGHAKYESLIGKLAQVATPPVLICKAHGAAEANVRQLHHWPRARRLNREAFERRSAEPND